MKTEIQKRIENLVTDSRGYLKIPTSRLFGDKRALNKWLDFSVNRKDVEKIINNCSSAYENFKKEFGFLSWYLPNKLYIKNDEISYWDYLLIDSELKLTKAMSFFSMITDKELTFLVPERIHEGVYELD